MTLNEKINRRLPLPTCFVKTIKEGVCYTVNLSNGRFFKSCSQPNGPSIYELVPLEDVQGLVQKFKEQVRLYDLMNYGGRKKNDRLFDKRGLPLLNTNL
jgi:hypothetical protein